MALGSIERLQHYFTKTGLIVKKAYGRGVYLSIHGFQVQCAAKGSHPCNWKPQCLHQSESIIQWPSRTRPPSITSTSASDDARPPDSGLLSVNGYAAPSSGFDLLRALKLMTHAIRTGFRPTSLTVSDDAYDVGSDHSSRGRVASPTELSDVPTDASFSVSVMQVGGRRESILVWDDGWLYKQDLRIKDIEKQRGVVARYLDTVDEVLFGGSTSDVRGWVYEQERAARKEKRPTLERAATQSRPDSIRDLVVTEESEILVEEDGDDDDGDGDDETSSVDDDDLPRWAKRSAFPDDPLIRVHALLVTLLPAFLLFHLPGSQDRAEFLNALSSGQLLCLAYNAGFRQSRKPWGHINTDSIHDIIALEAALTKSEVDGSQEDLEEKGRKVWTFRRTDNLRLWGRCEDPVQYHDMLPIISPATPDVPTLKPNPTGEAVPPSPSSSKFSELSIFFDAREVVRQDDGWENMLERVL
ncbi:hypothetical protein EDB86DRAFT_3087730 [Lactarius hatsudake]|nr:hypothetical protein EDB86DRAFT_3087730 [Lactarius hatsudake]